MDASGVSRGLGVVTWAAFAGAALLPWYGLLSGVFALYFFFLLLAGRAGELLFAAVLGLSVPLAALLLFLLPAGLAWAALTRRPPGGLVGRIVRAGCLAEMFFAGAYGLMLLWANVAGVWEDPPGPWNFLMLFHAGVLGAGFLAAWRSWRWLRGPDVVRR